MSHRSEKYSSRDELSDMIVDWAMQAFTTKGIKDVTMNDVSTALGISKRTLYEVFPDKESLLISCIHKNEQIVQAFLKEILSTARNVLEMVLHVYQISITRLQNINPSFFTEILKYQRAYRLYMDYREETAARSFHYFQEGVDQGIFRPDVNYTIVNELIRSQFKLLIDTKIYRKYSFVEVLESIIFTFLRGICTVQGAKILDTFINEYRKQPLGSL